ncbi:hypothetical protein CEQ90_16770 [Lewinellaceae bacterium SD302]|nr:hypothetical protein CEQ90_16770 [Lewinellaceae bacterium SD302]
MPQTIEEVLAALDAIIASAIADNDPAGYFAYVYRRTTAAVRDAIFAKRFQDNERMERFDVLFANLYLAAYEQYRCDEPCSVSWQLAFNEDRRSKAILQHVMLGMNAHINLDLGVAAAKIMKGRQLNELAHDFRLVNEILQEIVEELQERVGRVSPVFGLFDRFGRDRDERLLDFSMRVAREQAWIAANRIWEAAEANQTEVVEGIDKNIYQLGTKLGRPTSIAQRWLWQAIAAAESKKVGENISLLGE